jgi:hypothetical protein
MSSTIIFKSAFAILTLIPLARSQFVSSLPQCVQDCIDSSQDDNCAVTNVGCLCRASAGNFLPDLITCIHSNCDNDLDNSLLLTPLQWACELAGSPIPESALRNAENQASSLAAQVTMTVTVGASSSGRAQATTTIDEGSVTKETVTTTASGSTIILVYPVTEWSTTTVSGAPSTVTSTSTTEGAVSTSTTTDAKGSTTTQNPTFTTTQSSSSGSGASESVSSSTTVTTSIAADKTSSSGTQSKTSTSSNPVDTNSSPFQDSNAAARTPAGNLLGLTIALALGCVWF